MSTEGGTKAIWAAFAANFGIAVAKFVGFLFTGSGSLLAEGVHSLADTGNQGLLLLGNHRARRKATPKHPFGHGRERYFWAFVVSLVLFSLGSLFAVGEGIEKLRHPTPLESLPWALGILAVSILLESGSFWTAWREAKKAAQGKPLWEYVVAAKAPEIPVVLLEDIGALAGLVLAMAAILVSYVTGDPRWDGLGTVSIGILLGVIAGLLAVEMKSLLIGEGASPEEARKIEQAIATSPHVVRLVHLRTQYLGPEELLVAAKVEFRAGLPADELARAVDAVEANVREVVPAARPMYIEPGRPTE